MAQLTTMLDVLATGTSEGAKKGWDARGRSDKQLKQDLKHPSWQIKDAAKNEIARRQGERVNKVVNKNNPEGQTHFQLQKNGYSTFSGKGFGVQDGETAYSKGRGQDRHVVVVGEDGVRDHQSYGSRAGQMDEAHYSHGEFQKKLAKGAF
jgi:hypothetical protein